MNIIRQAYPFNPKEQHHIRTFVYKASTASLTYHNIWSPLADRMVEFFPRYIAPNLITMTGFLLVLFSQMPLLYYGHDNAPSWSIYLFSICLLIYQQLDNIDGKQARRTKTGSPLGMLFDHGLDAITCYSLTLCTSVALNVTQNNHTLFTLMVINGGFFLGTLWQYHYGTMEFGLYSPPDDGIPTVYLICLVSGYMGSQLFALEYMGIKLRIWFCYLVYFLSITTLTPILYKAYKSPFCKAFYFDTLQILILNLTSYAVYPMFQEIMYPYILCYVMVLGRNTNILQIGHVTKTQFRQFNKSYLLFIVAVWTHLAFKFKGLEFMSDKAYFWTLGVLLTLNYIVFAMSAVVNMADCLGIKVFTIPNKQKQ